MESTVERTMIRASELNTGSDLVATKQSFAEELDQAAKVIVLVFLSDHIVFLLLSSYRNWRKSSEQS